MGQMQSLTLKDFGVAKEFWLLPELKPQRKETIENSVTKKDENEFVSEMDTIYQAFEKWAEWKQNEVKKANNIETRMNINDTNGNCDVLLLRLRDDLLWRILEYLSGKEMLWIEWTCKKLYLFDSSYVWKNRLQLLLKSDSYDWIVSKLRQTQTSKLFANDKERFNNLFRFLNQFLLYLINNDKITINDRDLAQFDQILMQRDETNDTHVFDSLLENINIKNMLDQRFFTTGLCIWQICVNFVCSVMKKVV